MTFVTLGQEFSKILARDGKFLSKGEALISSPLLPAQDGKPLSFEEAKSTGNCDTLRRKRHHPAIVFEALRIEDLETYPASRTCELAYGTAEEQ